MHVVNMVYNSPARFCVIFGQEQASETNGILRNSRTKQIKLQQNCGGVCIKKMCMHMHKSFVIILGGSGPDFFSDLVQFAGLFMSKVSPSLLMCLRENVFLTLPPFFLLFCPLVPFFLFSCLFLLSSFSP